MHSKTSSSLVCMSWWLDGSMLHLLLLNKRCCVSCVVCRCSGAALSTPWATLELTDKDRCVRSNSLQQSLGNSSSCQQSARRQHVTTRTVLLCGPCRAISRQPWLTYESSSVVGFHSTAAPVSAAAALDPAHYQIIQAAGEFERSDGATAHKMASAPLQKVQGTD